MENKYKLLIENRMKVAQDTKKQFDYCKHSGTWSWFDKEDKDNQHKDFKTFIDALFSATEPYFD